MSDEEINEFCSSASWISLTSSLTAKTTTGVYYGNETLLFWTVVKSLVDPAVVALIYNRYTISLITQLCNSYAKFFYTVLIPDFTHYRGKFHDERDVWLELMECTTRKEVIVIHT